MTRKLSCCPRRLAVRRGRRNAPQSMSSIASSTIWRLTRPSRIPLLSLCCSKAARGAWGVKTFCGSVWQSPDPTQFQAGGVLCGSRLTLRGRSLLPVQQELVPPLSKSGFSVQSPFPHSLTVVTYNLPFHVDSHKKGPLSIITIHFDLYSCKCCITFGAIYSLYIISNALKYVFCHFL